MKLPQESGSDSDEELLARQATGLLRMIILLTLSLGVGLGLLVVLGNEQPQPLGWAVVFGLALLCGVSLLLLEHYPSAVARRTFTWGFTGLIVLQCLLVNGIRSPIAALLPVVVMLSAWSGRQRETLALGLFALSALGLMAGLDGIFWPQQQPRSALNFWASYAFCIITGSVIASRIAHTLQGHYSRQKQLGEQLADQVREMQQAREKFSTFFFMNPVPVSITSLSTGRYVEVNPAWEKIGGWTGEELRGRNSLDLGIWVTPEEREEWIAEFSAAGRMSNRLTRFRLRDGLIRYFLASSEVINYEGERCVFAAFIDITEQREAEARLRELNVKLEEHVAERTRSLAEANQSLARSLETLQQTQDELVHAETMASLGSMVAGISHELNTPIGNALTVSTALQDQVRDFSERIRREPITKQALFDFLGDQHTGADLVAQSLLRAAELVTSFKQVAVDQASERRRGFDLAGAMGDILSTLRPMFKHKPIELRVDLAPGIAMDSYPGPLGQVISNLTQNAILHGLDGADHGTVSIETRAVGTERLEIVVSDNGRGIAAEHLPRIFDPFFTTRLGRGGSGLGLSITHRLVTTILGGSISVRSTEGEGASFRLELPRIAPQREEVADDA
ncbi:MULTISPECIES: sensor histidine kinase [unclassified Uliginosibacterium]|uniref:sensor histidine kinase n=1 Tax=unclassified Uliginosibacterium TaxID=2621521 RepID=UPI000C7A00D9|nr:MULTISPECIES: ATP-binding protein [unclassified Uliginosibacterium]MDO6386547.1 ATP-binding protein [Uliginosibacterium sp. 31-12]PLK50385.1 hypothetical protein C0V76_00705 [Uliginosibacterium sp. TH139]